MHPASLEALAAAGAGAPDDALAGRHLPVWLLDANEPYQPLAAGYTVLRAPGRSPSGAFDIVPKAAAVIEYAVWYDWDIGHLYDLEHVWVHVDDAGVVIAVEASMHGRRGGMDAGAGLPEMHGGRPVVLSEPGKHAHWARAEDIDAAQRERLVGECGTRAGIEGVHQGNPFAASGAYKASDRDHELARRKMQGDAFRPSFDFVAAKAEALLVPWPALAAWIPRRVALLMAALREA
jgi:putative hydrolase of the HAD superfamily